MNTQTNNGQGSKVQPTPKRTGVEEYQYDDTENNDSRKAQSEDFDQTKQDSRDTGRESGKRSQSRQQQQDSTNSGRDI